MAGEIKRGKVGEASNRAKFETYIEELKAAGQQIPERDGGPNISAIAKATEIGRNAFYGSLKEDLAVAVEKVGLQPRQAGRTDELKDPDLAGEQPSHEVMAKKIRELQRDLGRTRRQLADERAKNAALSRELRQQAAVDEIAIPLGLRLDLGTAGSVE